MHSIQLAVNELKQVFQLISSDRMWAQKHRRRIVVGECEACTKDTRKDLIDLY